MPFANDSESPLLSPGTYISLDTSAWATHLDSLRRRVGLSEVRLVIRIEVTAGEAGTNTRVLFRWLLRKVAPGELSFVSFYRNRWWLQSGG